MAEIFLKYLLVEFLKICNFVVSAIKGRYQSGQMEQTVNLPASPSEVRILPCPHNCEHLKCGSNSVGRVTAFQAVGREFESRLPLNRINAEPLYCMNC